MQAAWQGGQVARLVGEINLAIVSAAERTRQTLTAMASGGLKVAEARFENSLYTDPWESILAMVRELDADVSTALVIGHEPVISLCALMLAENPQAVRGGFSPGTAVIFDVESWQDVDRGTQQVRERIVPAAL